MKEACEKPMACNASSSSVQAPSCCTPGYLITSHVPCSLHPHNPPICKASPQVGAANHPSPAHPAPYASTPPSTPRTHSPRRCRPSPSARTPGHVCRPARARSRWHHPHQQSPALSHRRTTTGCAPCRCGPCNQWEGRQAALFLQGAPHTIHGANQGRCHRMKPPLGLGFLAVCTLCSGGMQASSPTTCVP